MITVYDLSGGKYTNKALIFLNYISRSAKLGQNDEYYNIEPSW